MKTFKILIGLLALLLNACNAQTPPTIDPAQIQASADVMVKTAISMTQTAIPTNTPSPIPTDTPFLSPTPTLEATTLSAASTQTALPKSEGNDCRHALDLGGAGPTHRTVIKNQTSTAVNLSLNLYKPNAFGACGAISYANLRKGDQVTAELPSGYWYAYMWGIGKSKFSLGKSFFVQPAQFDKLELCLRTNVIKYAPHC